MKESITSVDCAEGDQDREEIKKSNVRILHQTFISFSSLTLRKQICLYYGNYGFFSDTTAGTTKIFNILYDTTDFQSSKLRIFDYQSRKKCVWFRYDSMSSMDDTCCFRLKLANGRYRGVHVGLSRSFKRPSAHGNKGDRDFGISG